MNTHARSELTDEHTEITRDHKRSLSTYLTTVSLHGDTIAGLTV
jgi:hypothetical protein